MGNIRKGQKSKGYYYSPFVQAGEWFSQGGLMKRKPYFNNDYQGYEIVRFGTQTRTRKHRTEIRRTAITHTAHEKQFTTHVVNHHRVDSKPFDL